MNILVLNGSPKGTNSVTLQTCLYLEKLYPEHSFAYLHVGAQIRALERDFFPVKKAVEEAELILFSYPVYTFIAPYQLHRFIELLKASGLSLKGKFATQFSTSKHFYDVTAHEYIRQNCQDLGMKYIRGLSADMDDLPTEKGQKEARDFLKYTAWCVEQDIYEEFPEQQPEPVPVPVSVPEADILTVEPADIPAQPKPAAAHSAQRVPASAAPSSPAAAHPAQNPASSRPVALITDCRPEDTQLQSMIDRFRAVFPEQTKLINIREFPFKGGCLGCFNCAVSGKCIYTDGFDDFLRNEIETCRAVVYAFTIQDHCMSPVFKMYNDRQFCNGHRTVTMGSPVGYLVSGSYSRESNLQMILEGRAQVGGNFLSGVATDEKDPDREIDRMAARLAYALEHSYAPPQNFYGVGGMKIFRDLIWLMQGMMRADHKFYKAHGQYDFPQKKWPTMLAMYAVGQMLASPKLKAKIGNQFNEGMLMPYKKVLDSVEIQNGDN